MILSTKNIKLHLNTISGEDCSCRAVKAAAGYKVSGLGLIPAAPTSRDSLMTALGAGNKYPKTQGLGLGKPRFFAGELLGQAFQGELGGLGSRKHATGTIFSLARTLLLGSGDTARLFLPLWRSSGVLLRMVAGSSLEW